MRFPSVIALAIALTVFGSSGRRAVWASVSDLAGARCVAFSPYVDGYNPSTGPHPPPAVIDSELDRAVAYGLNCIETYGVLNGLDYTFAAAQRRNMKSHIDHLAGRR